MRPDPYFLEDTIVAPATPPGRSALALLRLSGPRTAGILRAVAPDLPATLPDRRPLLARLSDPSGSPIDRGLVTFFASPRSVTGEDVAEISVHGGPALVRALLSALIDAGARPARPGEFTQRAFLLGKVDLVEAEAVRDLVEARTPAAVSASARRLDGSLSRRLAAVRASLATAAAEIEAALDFSEDVGEALPAATAERIAFAAQELECLSRSGKRGRLLAGGARVVLLGRPNAGKSTLFNALVGAERAIVTSIPGTTRDTLDATIDVRGIPVELVDTAGLRATEDPIESLGVERARAAGESADAVLYVVDAVAGWSGEDESALATLPIERRLVIANKIDGLASDRRGVSALLPPSALTRPALALYGLSSDAGEILRSAVAGLLESGLPPDTGSEMLGSARQQNAVDRAWAASVEALAALGRGESPEYPVSHVHDALDALAELSGETTPEDVLSEIFATFCIGK
ncbi:MAG: tRNA uridine-5-carboxymethylaminomethyl(34) synthesis GTPase MnmE [Acidobacteria bacterium]|nr:tRNA uridine-5-carboxymethylaminomethyl(34) synthesis GTPase MnmE [Acidobacteriota bacterium]MCA1611196.1 tRNA uridine-5-carboxymethylaminomethyl(34) synthesis GTPase MnmE [Acidobacteriota bacterium]